MSEIETYEYVIIRNENYKAKSVSTGIDSIKIALADMQIADAVSKFQSVTELNISAENLQPYGFYKNLTFTSATVDAEGIVTIQFSIASQEKVRIASLEQSQAEQDAVIAELIGGDI